MGESIPQGAIRPVRTHPGYIAEALKSLIETNVPIKEIHLASGEPLNYRSPEGYRVLNEGRAVSDGDLHQLMDFAADSRYDPKKRVCRWIRGYTSRRVDRRSSRMSSIATLVA